MVNKLNREKKSELPKKSTKSSRARQASPGMVAFLLGVGLNFYPIPQF